MHTLGRQLATGVVGLLGGVGDFLVETSRATVEMLKKHGFDVVYKETSGGHTWANWRDYLAEFAPQLFR